MEQLGANLCWGAGKAWARRLSTRRASAPETTAAATEVPLPYSNRPGLGAVEITSTPGATRSGFEAPWLAGPRLESG